ncbi:hypothetical protein [Schumannella sp. 10F1B-5-1]|uniref:DUF6993 domain-containing protein n=1 Tax=Schumannella sp. 10F1B-5-1 TaxID=2590780 RepID=UPI001132887A|nr:hypothetical protein [Schumannella sp. 10F1B-5-1]TPW70098.1 hypothetical protein FJ658_13795 [Schumannella sp. 10F1B-5-1]
MPHTATARHRVGVAIGSGTAAVALAGVLLTGLAGCTPSSPEPSSSPKPSASASASAAPKLDPTGDAADNKAYFDSVNQKLIAAGGTLDGRAFIDDLVKAGFDKAAMEVTADTTAVGLKADNIQFSVKLGVTCLIGQYGNIGYASTTAPALDTGTCLVGQTRAIDW